MVIYSGVGEIPTIIAPGESQEKDPNCNFHEL
jgi:hypothetical protein